MSSWKVIWQRILATIWNNAQNRNEVTHAAYWLDEAMKRNPLQLGESRGGLRRMAFQGQLCITFEVVPDDKKVYVLTVSSI